MPKKTGLRYTKEFKTGGFVTNVAAVDYDSASSIAAAAASRMFGSTWEYVSRVMAMVACPSISDTIFGFTLGVRSSVAHVWRSQGGDESPCSSDLIDIRCTIGL
jgi:hypothetical protein